jgi:uncharacterized surface protein with fasciclin (FAS1) repeats
MDGCFMKRTFGKAMDISIFVRQEKIIIRSNSLNTTPTVPLSLISPHHYGILTAPHCTSKEKQNQTMAISRHAPLISLTIILTFLSFSNAQPAAPAPGPAGPVNLTAILEKGGQYTSFIRLLKETQLDKQINSQLNNSFNGLTVLAPTDNAFNNLKAGTLNSLSQQEQVALVLYHVLPKYYTSDMFQTVSNPVRTQASGSNGVYTVNITSATNQVLILNKCNFPNSLFFPLQCTLVDLFFLF